MKKILILAILIILIGMPISYAIYLWIRLKKAVNELVSSIYSRYCFALIYCLQIMLSGVEFRARLWEVRT